MAGATPNLALPYPTGADLVRDGDNAIQALAEALDAEFYGSKLTGSLSGVAAASGWNGIVATGYKIDNLAWVGISANRSGAATSAGDTGSPATSICTLPAGWRPIQTAGFVGSHTAGIGIGRVMSDGSCAVRYWSLGLPTSALFLFSAVFAWQ